MCGHHDRSSSGNIWEFSYKIKTKVLENHFIYTFILLAFKLRHFLGHIRLGLPESFSFRRGSMACFVSVRASQILQTALHRALIHIWLMRHWQVTDGLVGIGALIAKSLGCSRIWPFALACLSTAFGAVSGRLRAASLTQIAPVSSDVAWLVDRHLFRCRLRTCEKLGQTIKKFRPNRFSADIDRLGQLFH
jgi:hypothetical protein